MIARQEHIVGLIAVRDNDWTGFGRTFGAPEVLVEFVAGQLGNSAVQ
jgi:hypothetical protein